MTFGDGVPEECGKCRGKPEWGQNAGKNPENTAMPRKFIVKKKTDWELDTRPPLSHCDRQSDCILPTLCAAEMQNDGLIYWWWNLHVSQAHDMQQQQGCLWWDSEAKSNGVERFEKNAAQKLGKCSAGKIASCSSRGPESSSQHSLKFRANLPEPQHYRCQTRDVRNITLTPSKWKPACLTKKKLPQESRNRQPVRLHSQSIHYLDHWNLDTRKQRNDTFLNVSKI